MTFPGSAGILLRDTRLIQIVNAALADTTLRSGPHLVCHPGCTPCCHGAFAIGPLDALRLRDGMATLTETDPARAAVIQTRARAYLSEYGPSFPGNLITGILHTGPEAQESFEDFANEAPCPALDPQTGLCDVYEFRPMTCRVFGPPVRTDIDIDTEAISSQSEEDAPPAFSVCELCFTHATPDEIAAAEMHVPHEEEERLVEALLRQNPSAAGDTIIAYCLAPPPPVLAESSSAPR